MSYPTGSAFPGGIGYPSRRNPDGVCITPAGGAVFSGMPIQAGYPTGVGLLVNFRYSSGLDLPIGYQNPNVIQGRIAQAVLIIAVGELPHRF